MLLTDEPGATIRALIGDERALELGRLAYGLVRGKGFTTEELVYIAQCIDYMGFLSSEEQEMRLVDDQPEDSHGRD